MLVCVSSVKGAPGVSSWALSLAAAWPHSSDRVLVEADGSGGVMAARYGLPVTPGVADLVTEGRRGTFETGFRLDSVARLLRNAEGSEERLWAVPAPLASHDAQAAWVSLVKPAADSMVGDPRLWVTDCGRVWAGAPAEVLITSANLNVVVSDDAVPSLVALQPRIQAIPGQVALLVVGGSKYTTAELTEFTGATQVWKVPRYGSLAEKAGGFATGSRRARRGKSWQTALTIAHELAAGLTGQSAPVHMSVPTSTTPAPAGTPVPVGAPAPVGTPVPLDAPTPAPPPEARPPEASPPETPPPPPAPAPEMGQEAALP